MEQIKNSKSNICTCENSMTLFPIFAMTLRISVIGELLDDRIINWNLNVNHRKSWLFTRPTFPLCLNPAWTELKHEQMIHKLFGLPPPPGAFACPSAFLSAFAAATELNEIKCDKIAFTNYLIWFVLFEWVSPSFAPAHIANMYLLFPRNDLHSQFPVALHRNN